MLPVITAQAGRRQDESWLSLEIKFGDSMVGEGEFPYGDSSCVHTYTDAYCTRQSHMLRLRRGGREGD